MIAAVLVAFAPGDPTPFEMGRASVFAGMCMMIGWETSQDRVVAFAQAYDARNPTDDMDARQAEIMRGIEDARVGLEAVKADLAATGDVAAFRQALSSRCDGVVRDIPEILSRTDATQAAFDAAIAQIVSQDPSD